MYFPPLHMKRKKVLCLMGIMYEKIHACPNDYILYHKEHVDRHECHTCGAPRYKMKSIDGVSKEGPPAKVLWYLPIIPRLRAYFQMPQLPKA